MPGAIQDVSKRIYSEFFPNSDKYARRQEVYEIEWFENGDNTSDSYVSEAWVPVVEK